MSQVPSGGRPTAAKKQSGARPSQPGVSIKARGDITATNSTIAGGDVTTVHDNRQRSTRIQIGGVVAVLALAAVGYGVYHAVVPSSIVDQAGVSGATGTLQQMQQAEENGDSASWCFLASSADSSTCNALLSAGWSTAGSQTNRQEISSITIGSPSGNGGTYTFSLDYKGHSYNGVMMQWNGQRWEMEPGLYDIVLLDGGVFNAVIADSTGQGSLFGMPVTNSGT